VVANFINWLLDCGGRLWDVRWLFGGFPVCFGWRFEKISEKILEQSNSAGEFDIDVGVIFGDEPRNMGSNTLVLGMLPPVFKVCNID
jgi:hypothetical protein